MISIKEHALAYVNNMSEFDMNNEHHRRLAIVIAQAYMDVVKELEQLIRADERDKIIKKATEWIIANRTDYDDTVEGNDEFKISFTRAISS